ncbi:MAG: FKBP-type peptidyl-prolyl cis-trans isomerase [Armatimonadetes bacterium]|nr:FKBP-type peptidyl-prolyl cis-trans isomerase [Akkermansiaceae bacterium]
MRQSIYNSAARVSLIALAVTGFAIAQTPEAPAEKTNEAPAKEAAPKEAAVTEVPAPPVSPEEIKVDSSYGFGFQSGQQLSRYGVGEADIDVDSFVKGFKAATAGKEPDVPQARLQAAMTALGSVLQQREKDSAGKNLETGKKFLEENGKRDGVITTKSGLQYEVLEKGGEEKYAAPKEGAESNKQFLVNYKGTLIDGKVFDQSPEGTPVPMTLEVIPGFKEALTTMPVGAKWKLFIPSGLAYGEERRSAEIAPNTTLIFELELVKIEDKPAAPEGAGFPVPVPAAE